MSASYYGILPSNVRYSSVSPSAKVMYTEFTALTQEQGFCWATNQYFADLYKVSNATVSIWVKELKDGGFIRVEVNQQDGNSRKVWLVNCITPIMENKGRSLEKPKEGSLEKPKEGSLEKPKDINSTSKNTRKNKEEDSLPLPFVSSEFKSTWDDWEEHRKHLGYPLTNLARKRQYKKAKEMGETLAIQKIDDAISAKYRDFFVPKAQGNVYNSKPYHGSTQPIKTPHKPSWEYWMGDIDRGFERCNEEGIRQVTIHLQAGRDVYAYLRTIKLDDAVKAAFNNQGANL